MFEFSHKGFFREYFLPLTCFVQLIKGFFYWYFFPLIIWSYLCCKLKSMHHGFFMNFVLICFIIAILCIMLHHSKARNVFFNGHFTLELFCQYVFNTSACSKSYIFLEKDDWFNFILNYLWLKMFFKNQWFVVSFYQGIQEIFLKEQ